MRANAYNRISASKNKHKIAYLSNVLIDFDISEKMSLFLHVLIYLGTYYYQQLFTQNLPAF